MRPAPRSAIRRRGLGFEALEARRLLAIDVSDFSTLSLNVTPNAIVSGPDGNLWFTESTKNAIATMKLDGTALAEYPLPSSNSFPGGIAVGSDHNLWFSEGPGRIGRFDPTAAPGSQFTEFPSGGGTANAITAGPDGNLWFTDQRQNAIGKITVSGVVTEYPIRPNANPPLAPYSLTPYAITAGPDGNLWFTEIQGNAIGKITPAGVVTEYFLSASFATPEGITAGPDGAVWFTEQGLQSIARITPGGVISEYPIFTGFVQPTGIATGPDGKIYFTESGVSRIGQLDPANPDTAAQEFDVPTSSSAPSAITAGSDGNVWFTEYNKSRIGRVNLPVNANPSADLYIQSLTGSADPVKAGDTLTYTIKVRNGGSQTAHNVVVYDPIPALTSFSVANGDSVSTSQGTLLVSPGTISGNSTTAEIIDQIGDLASGASAIITVKVHVTSFGDIANKVVVTSDSPESFPADNSATLHTTSQPLVTNFQLTSTLTTDAANGPLKWTQKTGAGTQGKFDWTLADLGGDAPHNVVVSMVIPKTLTNIIAFPPNVFSGVPNADGTTSLTFAWPTLSSGQKIDFGFYARPTGSYVNPVGNITVTANVTDDGQINGSSSPLSKSLTATVVPATTQLSIFGLMVGDALGAPMTFTPGDGKGTAGKFAWAVGYASGDAPTNVGISIQVPTTLDRASVNAFPPGTFSYDKTTGSLSFNFASLPSGKTPAFGFTATPTVLGDVSVTANVSADQQVVGAPLSQTVHTYVEQTSASLTLDGSLKTDNGADLMKLNSKDASVITPGTFSWTITNTGSTSATGVTASMFIPNNQLKNIRNLSSFPLGIPNLTTTLAGGILTFTLPDIPAGQSDTFSFTADPASIGVVSVTADVTCNEKLVGGGPLHSTISTIVMSDLSYHLDNPYNPSNAKPAPAPGLIIPNADLVPIYYGKQWTKPGPGDTWTDVSNFPAQMDAAMKTEVTGPYMDFLSQYNTSKQKIGRGTIEPDRNQASALAPVVPAILDDTGNTSDLRKIIQNDLDANGYPDPKNTVFVIFTPPGTKVYQKGLGDSATNFRAYHGAYSLTKGKAHYTYYYIAMPYQDTTTNNTGFSSLTSFQNMTETFSHELAEAVTDPVVGTGWNYFPSDYPASATQEIGDLENSVALQKQEGGTKSYGTLDGVLVQYEWANQYTYPGTDVTVFNQPVLPQGAVSKSLKLTHIIFPLKPAAGAGAGGEPGSYSFSGLIGAFQDSSNPGTDPSIYTATIDWGDNATSPGTLTYDANLNQFLISGSHSFALDAGSTATINITVVDNANGDVASLTADVTLEQATSSAATVQFDQAAIEAYRNGSGAAIVVDRVGDATLPATVDYHVSGGTAADGTDYQAQSGTLQFAAGATQATIVLPIYSNPSALSDQTVNLVLSTPTGNTVLGAQTATTITIHPSDQIYTPPAPTLDSDTGALVIDNITAHNGSAGAPLIFNVAGAGVPNGYLQLVDVTDPTTPVVLGDPAQAQNGAAKITLNGGALTDGTHKIAVINSVSLATGPRRASPAMQIVIDSQSPSSNVAMLPGRTSITDLPIIWNGADNAGGSGIDTYDVSVSVDGASPTPLLTNTTLTSLPYAATLGHTYAFFAQTYDVAGNAEPAHATADTTVRVTATPWQNERHPLDVSDDGFIAPNDALAVINYINSSAYLTPNGLGVLPTSAAANDLYLDVSGDNLVAPGDALTVINAINAGQGGAVQGEGESTAGSAPVAASTSAAPVNAPDETLSDLIALLAQDSAQAADNQKRAAAAATQPIR